MDSDYCFVKLIFTTTEDPNFIVQSNNSINVGTLIVVDSVIPVLTGEYCKIFPNLDKVMTYNCSVEALDAESFVHCAKLTKLWLMKDEITDLNARMFYHLKNLEELVIDKQKISSIHPEAFVGLGNLKVLSLAEDKLSFIDPEVLLPLKSLNIFSVFGNDLEDLNVERILEIVPLKYIVIDDNDFPCKQMSVILETLKNANIEVSVTMDLKHKTRSYPISKIDDNVCIPDVFENYETTTEYWTSSSSSSEGEKYGRYDKLSEQVTDLTKAINSTVETINAIKKETLQSLMMLGKTGGKNEVKPEKENDSPVFDSNSMVEFHRQQVLTQNLMLKMQLAIIKCHSDKLDQINEEISQIREVIKAKE